MSPLCRPSSCQVPLITWGRLRRMTFKRYMVVCRARTGCGLR
jgi:hypothetical protein